MGLLSRTGTIHAGSMMAIPDMLFFLTVLALLGWSVAATPTVIIPSPAATVIGKSDSQIDTFNAIPFVKPPTGQNRLKPPQPLDKDSNLGVIQAGKASSVSCPYFIADISSDLPGYILGTLVNNPFIQKIASMSEDCLTLDVIRPAVIEDSPTASLPVVFWIYGGAFELGSSGLFNGTHIVQRSIGMGKPIIWVAVNYRIGGLGFLGGKEILADGASNLGLLDQRAGLEWVAENIAAFGGDPDKVTIFGESAGAISVLDQMVMYDGDHTYKGKPLFRAGIMNSGSVYGATPVDSPPAQEVYDSVVEAAGCKSAFSSLECLRSLSSEKVLNALSSVPSFLSYHSVALSYLPRPDGKIITDSTDRLVKDGKIAQVPFIVGNQQDEGCLFSIFTSNISTTNDVIDWFSNIFYTQTKPSIVRDLVYHYPNDPGAGAPYNTGMSNNWYPQFKRMASIMGDVVFIMQRRYFLTQSAKVNPHVPSWSFMARYDEGTPIVGTTHGTDLLKLFFTPDETTDMILDYYLSFVHELDPNKGNDRPEWPQWSANQSVLDMGPDGVGVIADDFRRGQYYFFSDHMDDLRI